METILNLDAIPTFLTPKDLVSLRLICFRWNFSVLILQNKQICPKKSVLSVTSTSFRHKWQHYFREKSLVLQQQILSQLPNIQKEKAYELIQNLCKATNYGVMPSFGDAGARSGYIQKKFNRAINLPNLLLSNMVQELRVFVCEKKTLKIASIGGGPGFDVIGLYLLSEYARLHLHIDMTVYDYEHGWYDAVKAVGAALNTNQENKLGDLHFANCDITTEMNDDCNMHLLSRVEKYDMFVFSFVCIENYQLLKQRQFIFLKELFQKSSVGSFFIFMDSTHRLWGKIWSLSDESNSNFKVWTPFVPSCRYSMILRKVEASINPADDLYFRESMKNIEEFEIHRSMQDVRLSKTTKETDGSGLLSQK